MRLVITALLSMTVFSSLLQAQQKVAFQPSGIVVLDNTDGWERGKVNIDNKVTLLDGDGKQLFQNTGLSLCETVGSCHAIATDHVRLGIWVIENVGHCIRRYDLAGKETIKIDGVQGTALAVDLQTGNLWTLQGSTIHNGAVVIYDTRGRQLKSFDISGFDIVYDKKAKAFWVAGKEITKIEAATGKILFSKPISTWTTRTLDVDQTQGHVWVHASKHDQVQRSTNQLLKFDGQGNQLFAIDWGEHWSIKISVDSVTGRCWAIRDRDRIECFSKDGKSEAVYQIPCLSVQVEKQGSHFWIVTATEIQRVSPKGEILKRVPLSGRTNMAWIGLLE